NSHIEIIANNSGNRKTPSCDTFTSDEQLVGNETIDKIYPKNTIISLKRMMDRIFIILKKYQL
ncbi:hypothetical protein LY90DRAFT_419219, partial [Neocallimastix californiae]